MKIVILIILYFFVINSISLYAKAEGEYFHEVDRKGDGFEIYEVRFYKDFFTNPSIEVFKPEITWVYEAEENLYSMIAFSTLTYEIGRAFRFKVHFDLLPSSDYAFIDILRIRPNLTLFKLLADYAEAVFFKKNTNMAPQNQDNPLELWATILVTSRGESILFKAENYRALHGQKNFSTIWRSIMISNYERLVSLKPTTNPSGKLLTTWGAIKK